MKKLQFLHTSDVHLDTSFSGSGLPSRLGAKKREAIRSSFRRILEDAKQSCADLVLIAGDLFEHDRVSSDTVEFLKQQFESLGSTPVFIAPGNHDPFIQGSPYREESWPGNVHIFAVEEFRSVVLEDLGVRVTGFGFNRTRVEEHSFGRLDPLSDDLFNIVMAHGSDLSCIPKGKTSHAPLTIEEIAGKNVDYCALGHYHQQRSVSNGIDKTRVWYSGTPEGRGWDEQGSCGYLWVVAEEGMLRVESRSSGQFPFQTIEVDCESLATREQVLDAIRRHTPDPITPNTIVRVRLTGYLDPKLELSKPELEERLSGDLLYVQWEDRTIPSLDYESLAQEKTLRGRFIRQLNERIRLAPDEERVVLERARSYGVQALLGRELRTK